MSATPTMSAEVAALLARCRLTHDADVNQAQQHAKTIARRVVHGVARGRVSIDDVESLMAYGHYRQADETEPQFEARRRGLAEGLVAGMCDLADRKACP
jgi:hypothetical protein